MKWFYYKLLYKRRTILLLDTIIRTLILKIRRSLKYESSNIYKSFNPYASRKRDIFRSSKRNFDKIL